MNRRPLAILVPLTLLVGACSSVASAPSWTYPPAPATAAPTATSTADATESAAPPPSAPAVDPAAGEIAVVMTDAMRFEPGTITVAAGRAITFRVENAGLIPHEFFVGDAEEQEHHAAEMAEGGMHGHAGALRLEAGETGRVTMTFEKTGELLVGCHEPGHFDAGMVATLQVIG